jgi:hypothetical protein
MFLLMPFAALALAGCTTVSTVKLDADKSFLTADVAFKSVQQATIATCSVPVKPAALTAGCNAAIDILHTGVLAEAAGVTAVQTGNAADLQTAVTTLTNLPAQLVALGVLKAN